MAYKSSQRAERNLADAIGRAGQLIRPPADIKPSEFAAQYRFLSSESSASPGRYVLERTEYARGILDALYEPGIDEMVVMSSAQVAKTTILENLVSYFAVVDPGPILVVLPTLTFAESFSRDRLAPMIRDTPALRAVFSESRSRAPGSTMMRKSFRGGQVTITTSNSPASLASRPIRYLLFDEVDIYEILPDGDVVTLASKRTTAYSGSSKIAYFSTPTLAGTSRIERLYQQSDRRRYFVPHRCGVEVELLWENLKWREADVRFAPDGTRLRSAEDAWFECSKCGARIDDRERNEMVRHGRWRATAPTENRAGFWIWQGYSPFRTAKQTANEWLAALGHPAQEQAVKNTVRAETWRVQGQAPPWEQLYARSVGKLKPEKIPRDVLVITAGVDVQDDRVEMQFVGWGRGRRSWLLDYAVIPGAPADLSNPASALHKRLAAEIGRTWEHERGPRVAIAMTAIDDGFASVHVRDFVRMHSHSTIAVKGFATGIALLGAPSKTQTLESGGRAKQGVRSWPANMSQAKHELYGFLGLPFSQPTPPGWCEFYDQGEEFFRQLTAEEYVIVADRGAPRGEWRKPANARNEALDTRNLARVAAAYKQIERFEEETWAALEEDPALIAPAEPRVSTGTIGSKPAQRQQPSEHWGEREDYWS